MATVPPIREIYKQLMELTGPFNSTIANLNRIKYDEGIDKAIIELTESTIRDMKKEIEKTIEKLKEIDDQLVRESWDGD